MNDWNISQTVKWPFQLKELGLDGESEDEDDDEGEEEDEDDDSDENAENESVEPQTDSEPPVVTDSSDFTNDEVELLRKQVEESVVLLDKTSGNKWPKKSLRAYSTFVMIKKCPIIRILLTKLDWKCSFNQLNLRNVDVVL